MSEKLKFTTGEVESKLAGLEKEQLQQLFLQALEFGLEPKEASRLIGLKEKTSRAWLASEPDFSEAFEDALLSGKQFIEQPQRSRLREERHFARDGRTPQTEDIILFRLACGETLGESCQGVTLREDVRQLARRYPLFEQKIRYQLNLNSQVSALPESRRRQENFALDEQALRNLADRRQSLRLLIDLLSQGNQYFCYQNNLFDRWLDLAAQKRFYTEYSPFSRILDPCQEMSIDILTARLSQGGSSEETCQDLMPDLTIWDLADWSRQDPEYYVRVKLAIATGKTQASPANWFFEELLDRQPLQRPHKN